MCQGTSSITFSDDAIADIEKTLDLKLSSARRELLKRILSEWGCTDLVEHLSREPRPVLKQRLHRLEQVKTHAQALLKALSALEPEDLGGLVWRGHSLGRTEYKRQLERLVEASEYIADLGTITPLLIAGALNRPEQQEAKTQFEIWWNLVGWAMEYAASLIGITVNCTELMKAGEVGDEEATAASVALTAMHEIWGNDPFTAKEVVEALTSEHADDQAKAELIANALEGLDGKRLDRPTAHSVGKLFQKRLVDRPAWIGDGQTVAI